MRRFSWPILGGLLLAAAACGPDKQQPAVEEQAPVAEPATEQPAAEGPKYVKIAPDEVDAEQRAAAEKFARNYMERRQAGKFEGLGPEATPRMRQGLTPEKERRAFAELEQLLGEYRSLEYAEAWTRAAGGGTTIFRFRGTFSKDQNAEIRVVVDGERLISGFWIKPWQDSLEPPRPIRIPGDKVNAEHRAKAERLAKQLLERQRAGEFEPLGDEATPKLRATLTPEGQRASHRSIKPHIGAYRTLSYVETWKIKEDDQTIYRFRGDFTLAKPEVRVVFDGQGLLAGFWIRPWRDEIN